MDGQEYRQLFQYLNINKFPDGISENQKRVLRRKATSFKLKNEEVYYVSFDKKRNLLYFEIKYSINM